MPRRSAPPRRDEPLASLALKSEDCIPRSDCRVEVLEESVDGVVMGISLTGGLQKPAISKPMD
jgi:surface antigen